MKKYIFIAFYITCNALQAQSLDFPIYTKDKKIPAYCRVPDSACIIKREKRESKGIDMKICQLLNLNKETSLVLCDTLTDISGGYHETYQQLYQGINVEYSKCVVHFDKRGSAKMISGNLRTIENLTVMPNISARESKCKAIELLNKDVLHTVSTLGETNLRGDSLFKCYEGTLVVYMKENTPYLAYKHFVQSIIPSLNRCIYVDAETGDYLGGYSTICNISTFVSTVYSNTQLIETQYLNNSYVLIDNTRGSGIMTFRQNGNNFESSDNTWSNLSNYDRAAIDAHWGVEKTFDFYFSKFGRNSYDNYGSSIVSNVNVKRYYNGVLTDWANACWDTSVNQMLYGRYTNGNSFASLDVTAHELTHGVTQHTSNLIYERESGAINEGISDVFAVCVENEYKTGSEIWKMGEDITSNGIRNLMSPNCKYYHGNGWINTNQTPTEYNDYCGVHNNSGVFSYWFYLISMGGTGINESGFYYPVQGIGLDIAIQICYLMNTSYLSSDATFNDAKISSYLAAQALGYSDSIINQLRNAWIDVGVESPLIYINGTFDFCSSSTGTCTISDLPSNCTVNWYFTDGFGLSSPTIQSSGNTCTITNNLTSSYMGTLNADIYYQGTLLKKLQQRIVAHAGFYGKTTGNQLFSPSSPVWLSPGSSTTLKSPNLVNKNVTYSQTTPSSWYYSPSSGELTVGYPNIQGYTPVVINIQNAPLYSSCDNSYQILVMPTSVLPHYTMTVVGNNGQILVVLSEQEARCAIRSQLSTTSVSEPTWVLEVYDAVSGQKVITERITGYSAIAPLPKIKGTYIVRAFIYGNELNEKIVVK